MSVLDSLVQHSTERRLAEYSQMYAIALDKQYSIIATTDRTGHNYLNYPTPTTMLCDRSHRPYYTDEEIESLSN